MSETLSHFPTSARPEQE